VALLGLVAALAVPAHAESSFTVINKVQQSQTASNVVEVLIFDGKDGDCTKSGMYGERVFWKESPTFTCKGQSNDQCKVAIRVGDTNSCKDLYNTCNKKAVKVPDGATLKISGTADAPTCAFQ
jgi:hypothetical protein